MKVKAVSYTNKFTFFIL